MGISRDEVEEDVEDRRSWRNRVAQCVFDADERGTRNQNQSRWTAAPLRDPGRSQISTA